ncbi:hypothetical protein ASF53_17885 [Methylobacterium sp. Leaf123]|uniref:hypothetical protein n=1 Tax=Methylobacterium sp. Leaf123 TaxID=1736264 RepID=UPI0006FE2C49|nr:hypothetical protein [Methylobacterium sp. Leaf123]KQQ30648.1 hypothetical protein ASF53_17885 [Methylobacterium sp. Leaf123]
MRPALAAGLATLFALGAASGAAADPYVYGYGGGGYRFAGPVIEGAYLGAPFTRLPSTSRLVPPAWGYGTYGIPTAAGMRDAPAARPTLTVIERPASAGLRPAPRRHGARVLSKTSKGTWTDPAPRSEVEESGAQVVSVRVPARSR